MSREILNKESIHPDIKNNIGEEFKETINKIKKTIEGHPILIIGMAQNPVCKSAKKNLDEAKIAYKYLTYGSYFSEWKKRLAIKMWSGWPTYPMIFINGKLIGGNDELKKLLTSDNIQQLKKDTEQIKR